MLYLEPKILKVALVTPAIISVFYVFLSRPMLVGLFGIQVEDSAFQLLGILIVLLVVFSFLYLKFRSFFLISGGLMLSTTLIGGIVNSLTSGDPNSQKVAIDVSASSIVRPDDLITKPDIYLLIYDSYIGTNFLDKLQIDNKKFERNLSSKGFELYESIYTVWPKSLGSMSRVLEIETDVPASKWRKILAGKSTVNTFLRLRGYETNYSFFRVFHAK